MLSAVTEDRESRLGVDSSGRVFLVENHDEAYHIWRRAQVKDRTLVHIDAHHDMWWVDDHDPITIANFICPALKSDYLKEIIWVVPDSTFETTARRRAVLLHLRAIAKKHGPREAIRTGETQLSSTVLGKPLTVCTLRSLPELAESVLLDVDVDFFVIPYVSFGKSDDRGALPWCWPEELLARLRSRGVRTDLVTVSCSVEGGYTPLKWKYLGEELAERLKQAGGDETIIRAMDRMRVAAMSAGRGEFVMAEQGFLEARRLLPNSPAPLYHLAHLYTDMGHRRDAQSCCQQALALDPSYRTAYNSAGLEAYRGGRFRRAEREFRRTLELDPQDPYACFGLGLLAGRARRWKDAEELLRNSLVLDSRFLDAHRALGEVLARQGRRREAIEAYEQSLRLALAGCRTLDAPIMSRGEGAPHMQDPGHCRTYARLARLYALEGRVAEAINRYRISIVGGHEGAASRSHLAHLYAKQRQWRNASSEAWQALKRVPLDLWAAAGRLRRPRRRRRALIRM